MRTFAVMFPLLFLASVLFWKVDKYASSDSQTPHVPIGTVESIVHVVACRSLWSFASVRFVSFKKHILVVVKLKFKKIACGFLLMSQKGKRKTVDFTCTHAHYAILQPCSAKGPQAQTRAPCKYSSLSPIK